MDGAAECAERLESGHRALRGRRPCGVGQILLQKTYPLSTELMSPSHRRPGMPPGPHKLDVLSTFTICGLLLTSTWLGLSWAPFCLPQAPCACRRAPQNSTFLHRDLGANAKTSSFTGPGGRPGCQGQTKRGPRQPQPRVNGLTGRRDKGQRVHGIGLGGRSGGAAPVR